LKSELLPPNERLLQALERDRNQRKLVKNPKPVDGIMCEKRLSSAQEKFLLRWRRIYPEATKTDAMSAWTESRRLLTKRKRSRKPRSGSPPIIKQKGFNPKPVPPKKLNRPRPK